MNFWLRQGAEKLLRQRLKMEQMQYILREIFSEPELTRIILTVKIYVKPFNSRICAGWQSI